MTCRIDRRWTKQGLLLYISGRLASEDLEIVRGELDERRVIAIELSELELVDREAVQLLAQIEAESVELRGCPAYIREWITNERTNGQRAESSAKNRARNLG